MAQRCRCGDRCSSRDLESFAPKSSLVRNTFSRGSYRQAYAPRRLSGLVDFWISGWVDENAVDYGSQLTADASKFGSRVADVDEDEGTAHLAVFNQGSVVHAALSMKLVRLELPLVSGKHRETAWSARCTWTLKSTADIQSQPENATIPCAFVEGVRGTSMPDFSWQSRTLP